VTCVERLARSTFNLFGIVKRILDAKAISITGRAVGRSPKLTDAQKAARRRRAEGATLAKFVRSYNVSAATISMLTT
jgi:hypothetical protein